MTTELAAVVGALALGLGAPALAAPVADTSFTQADGARVLQVSIVIAAPPATVWRGLVDEPTLRRFGTPLVHVDLRNGGEIEQGFDAKGKLGDGMTIHHRIVGYLPERLLVLQNISTPPGVPGAEVYPRIVQIVQLDPTVDGSTKVTLSGEGYGPGAAFDALWGFFAKHNPEYLQGLKALSEAK